MVSERKTENLVRDALRDIKHDLWPGINFREIAQNPDFKEDSAREVIILPMLKQLGYKHHNIVRSKSLKHPYLKVGSNKKLPITLIPDYLMKVEENFAWVLDAKAPTQRVDDSNHIEQVYTYASHPEIRSTYFSLCNGLDFALYRRDSDGPRLTFSLDEIEHFWDELVALLSPSSFQTGKKISYGIPVETGTLKEFNYSSRPLLEEIPVRKRASKRHFGVHGYFTRQSWNVVSEYIRNFSNRGDVVLDPFGGSGVTAIEALMNGRKGISIDINPMAVFLVQSLIAPVKQNELLEAFEQIKNDYLKNEPKTKTAIKKAIHNYPQPKPLPLPKGSDVETVDKLFSAKQLAQLGHLKSLILKQPNENIRNSLLLAFSGVVTRVNLTYHVSNAIEAKTGLGGDAAAFRYYRYRIAPHHTDVDVAQTFELRAKRIIAAKREMEIAINNETISNAQILKGTATDLSFLANESVDYIYTDPPYGKKIPYLDLSAMWNAWLDLEVTEDDYQLEAIEGGERNKSKGQYNFLIAQSIKEMYRVLKFDRWMSFVFAHKDPEFWHLIIDTAESCGFEYIGAVPQKNGQTSFKKRQNPFTVLSGQLIINFRKVHNPKAILTANLGMDIAEIIMQTVEGIIAKNNGATLEQINDELIVKGLELGFLDLLKKQYSDLASVLMESFDYNEELEIFTIRKETKFKTHVDARLRVRYYIVSYLRRMDREGKAPTFDEITKHILPLLRNGATPEKHTILSVLEDVADRVGHESWKLRKDGLQMSLL